MRGLLNGRGWVGAAAAAALISGCGEPSRIDEPGKTIGSLQHDPNYPEGPYGYSIDNVENEDGVRCVGAPVFDHENRIAGGLSVAGPTYRMTAERVREFGPEAVATAAELSRRLGWAGGKAT